MSIPARRAARDQHRHDGKAADTGGIRYTASAAVSMRSSIALMWSAWWSLNRPVSASTTAVCHRSALDLTLVANQYQQHFSLLP